jgi:hypothetical protein
MSSHRHTRLGTALSVLVLAALACNLFGPTATSTPAFTPTPAASPTPLPPIAPNVIDTFPVRGDEQKVNEPITIYFDSPMDRTTVEAAFQISPAVPGTFAWSDNDQAVTFTPDQPLERAARYVVKLNVGARSKVGLALAREATFNVETVGFLEVTKVLPEPDTSFANVDSIITVMFNRPVVPLTDLASQASLPNPLTLTPAVEGTGEWLNTSIYVFKPARPLAGGQAYTGRIAAGLGDTTGGLLQNDYEWTFYAAPPQVVSSIPAPAQSNLALNQPITITFNQAMDRASTEAAFSLSGDRLVSGSFRWANDDTEVGFWPSANYAYNTTYAVLVRGAAQAVGQGAALGQDYAFSFSTVLFPAILSTDPSDGAELADFNRGFRVYFASPMDVSTLDANIQIVPEPTQVYTYWSDYDFSYYVGWSLKPSTQYQVTLKPGMRDPYGNPALTEARTVNFTTGPRPPLAFFNARGTVGTYSAYVPTELYVTTVNVDSVNLTLARLSLAEFFGATGPNGYDFSQQYQPRAEDILRAWTVPVQNSLNEQILTRVPLTEDGSALPAGVYYLRLDAPGQLPSYQIVVVTKTNLTLKMALTEALVWATDLQSGQVTPNLPVTLYDAERNAIAQGATDGQGVWRASFSQRDDLWGQVYALTPEGDLFAVTQTDWSDGLDPWAFNVPSQYYTQDYTAYVYTERPLYRPGQVVYFKGIVRRETDARFSIPDLREVPVQITNDRGEEVYSATLPLSSFGSFAGEFKIGDEAGLGYYSINALDPRSNEDNYYGYLGSVSFSVAQYRKPEFQVSVSAPQGAVVQGETIAATVEASFFFGGPVSNANVRWAVLGADYYFQYDPPPGGPTGYYDFNDFDYTSGASGPVYGAFGRLIMEKEGQTDAQGRATLSIPADLSDKGSSQLYTIEATVTDLNGQQVAARTEVIVHQGRFYVGVRPQEYVGAAGREMSFDLLTVNWDSTAFPNQRLKVEFYDHQWNCAMETDPETGNNLWTCEADDTLVGNAEATTDARGQAVTSFTPPEGGTYKVLVSGTDSAGHTIKSASYVWVTAAGDAYVLWRQNNSDRIDLVLDRKEYRPGDTAEILIPSPFQGGTLALITVERGGLKKHEVLQLSNNSTLYRLPITADYAPDIFFSVALVKGVDADNPAPAFKMGLIKLTVSPEQQQINLTLTPDKTKVGPRDTVAYTLKATDYTGRPVQAEFSLGVVDLAVLQLAQPNAPRILDYFYGERGLGVRTASGLTRSVDRFNVEAAEAKGGGGGAEAGFNDVRSNFLDTAYWSATVTTNANGEATVNVTLPDNLTTWRLDARGVTADTLVGQGEVDIIATKDLLIRPVTPRFFVVGDQAELAAVINNNTAQDIETTVTLAAAGVTLNSPAQQTVTIKANARAEVTWDVSVTDAEYADLTFTAEGGGLRDSSKPTLGLPPDQRLPILRYSAPEIVGTAGQLDDATPILEAISLPRRYDVTQGSLDVKVAHSLAGAITPGLDYLENPEYRYESTEGLVSSFLPNVLTYRALKKLNLANAELETTLTALVAEARQRLIARQHVDGGWGWWTEGESNPYITAYVLFGLSQARQNGFAVNEGPINSAAAYLQGQLWNPAEVIEGEEWRLNRQAFILYALADAGLPDTSATVQLYEKRDRLDAYARAFLALTLRIANPGDDSRIRNLLSDLNNAAVLSATGAHWEEGRRDWWNMNTDTRSTAIVLMTLARLDSQNPLIPNIVRWLMVARTVDGIVWETPQETAWSLIALTDWMDVSGELKADYNYRVSLNGSIVNTGKAEAGTVLNSQSLSVAVADLFKDQANRLVFERSAGDGRLYYTAHLNVYLPVEDVRAVNRGLVVGRQYTLVSKDCGGEKQPACPPISEAAAGDDIRVKVTLIAPNDLYYVALEDPFPAGVEPVDTSLLTTSVINEPPLINPVDPFYYGWGWWWFTKTEIRDSKLVLFADYLPRGTYEYVYTLHASRPGTYQVIPTTAREIYFPEVFGRGDGSTFVIKP